MYALLTNGYAPCFPEFAPGFDADYPLFGGLFSRRGCPADIVAYGVISGNRAGWNVLHETRWVYTNDSPFRLGARSRHSIVEPKAPGNEFSSLLHVLPARSGADNSHSDQCDPRGVVRRPIRGKLPPRGPGTGWRRDSLRNLELLRGRDAHFVRSAGTARIRIVRCGLRVHLSDRGKSGFGDSNLTRPMSAGECCAVDDVSRAHVCGLTVHAVRSKRGCHSHRLFFR